MKYYLISASDKVPSPVVEAVSLNPLMDTPLNQPITVRACGGSLKAQVPARELVPTQEAILECIPLLSQEPRTRFAQIYKLATLAAKAAVDPRLSHTPKEQRNACDCGFGWVEFRPATHPFIRWCRQHNHGDKHWKSGWQFWSPGQHPGQSIDVHYAGAKAFADVLKAAYPDVANGIYANQRLD